MGAWNWTARRLSPVPAGCNGPNSDTRPNATCRRDCGPPECGDGVVDDLSGETCDDPTGYWGLNCVMPGCQKRFGPAMILNTLSVVSDPDIGCDLDGDGEVDNWLAPLGQLGVIELNPPEYTLRILLELRRLNDPTGQNDADLDLAAYWGFDSESPPDPLDDFTGTEPFYLDPAWVGAGDEPTTLLAYATLQGGAFEGAGDVFALPLPGSSLALRRAHLTAHITTDGVRPTGAWDGQLCGVMTACDLDQMPNPVPEMAPADTFLELLLLLGASSSPSFDYSPDIDLDGDGPERYTLMAKPGPWFVVDTCIDGDGTVVHTSPTGRCPCDPRFADGYSVTLSFTAVGAEILGVCSGPEPPCE